MTQKTKSNFVFTTFLLLITILLTPLASQAAVYDFTPEAYPEWGAGITNTERGIIITANETFSITSMGILADLGSTTLRAEIYAWPDPNQYYYNPKTLLASATTTDFESGMAFQDVAIDFTFEAGSTYELNFDFLTYNSSDSVMLYEFHGLDASYSSAILDPPYTIGPATVIDGTVFNARNLLSPAIRVNAVPVPGAAWLLGAGLLNIAAIQRKKKLA